jgi:plasmid replication initiation protein
MNQLILKKGFLPMLKYHNDMNLIAFKDFSQRELNIFFSLCLLMKEKGTGEITLSYDEIKNVIPDRFESNTKFEEILESVYDKLLQLRLESRDKNKIEKFILFTSYKIHVNEKTVTINTNSDYSYILNNLSKNFTLFELQEFNELSSTYSKHMFRLLKQYRSTGFFRINVEEFRRLLDVPKSYTMKKIGVKVLGPIEKELVSYFKEFKIKKIKEGRSITNLEFTFKPQHYKCNDEIDTIDVEATQSNLIEEKQNQIICPKCGQELVKRTGKDGSIFWGHKNYLTSDCKATFSTIEEIEAEREKRINLIENEADRAKFEKEVKELINQHKDILKLISLDKREVHIEQIEQQDLFYQNPIIRIKIDKNAINVIKSCIEEWSK